MSTIDDLDLYSSLLFLSELAFRVNTDKATKKRSVLARGLPPFKRSKGPKGAKKDVTASPKDPQPIGVLAMASSFNPKDVHG